MEFGNRLRDLREDRGITQKELGKIINISDRVIGYYESNDRFPKDANILKMLARYFNVSVDYLLGLTNIQSPQSEFISESEASYNLNVRGLPEEAIQKVEDYIELLRLKYCPKNKYKR